MKNSWVLKAASALVNVGCCAGALGLVLFTQSNFGKGDTSAFLCWTGPLAVAIAASGSAGATLFNPGRLAGRLVSALLTAAALAYGWVWLVYLVLGASMNSFSFPVFYLWFIGNFAQLVFLGHYLPTPMKQVGIASRFRSLLLIPLLSIGGVVLLFIVSLAGSYLTKPEKDLYLIPVGFAGKFRVVYGQQCGSSPKYEEGRRVLQIPADGLLLIQPAFEAGWIDNEYYLINKAGHRQKIAEVLHEQEKRCQVPRVLVDGVGVFSNAMLLEDNPPETSLALHYADFRVFNKDTASVSGQIFFRQEQAFDSLMVVKVEACRKTVVRKQ